MSKKKKFAIVKYLIFQQEMLVGVVNVIDLQYIDQQMTFCVKRSVIAFNRSQNKGRGISPVLYFELLAVAFGFEYQKINIELTGEWTILRPVTRN
jgi:hypothetical protein